MAVVIGLASPASAAHDEDGDRHQVGVGETLSHMAERFGVSVDALAAANGLADPDVVYAGSWLAIPTGAVLAPAPAATHVVAPGENLSGIALVHGVSVDALTSANGISDPNLVVIGRRLVIPTGGAGPSGPVAVRTTSADWPRRLRNSPDRQALVPVFDLWAASYGVPADLVKAMTWLESGWQNGVVSSTGAVGVGQLMPDTVTFMRLLIGDVTLDPADAGDNIRMSVRYLGWLLQQTGGDATKALGGYYQGLRAVETRGLYAETVVYVNGVQQLRSRF